MKKIINESGKTHLAVDLMLYCVYVFIGSLLIKFPEIETLNPSDYFPTILYLLGFFSIITYFLNRRVNNYELLFLGLINIVIATFSILFSYVEDTNYIFAIAILLYSLFTILNKGLHALMLAKDKNVNTFPKTAITIILVLLGLLVFDNLITDKTTCISTLGYYFEVYGLMSLLEILIIILMSNDKIKKYCDSLLNEDNEKVTLERIKKTKTKKIIKKR